MELYIDESGTLGKKDRYFIIAMINPYNKNRIKNFLKKHCAQNGLEEVHGKCLTFPEKQKLIHKLAKKPDHHISYIVADKHHLFEKILKDKNLCFNYLMKYLLKKTITEANENVNILLDEHTVKVKSINSLADYIKIQAYSSWGFKHEINLTYTDSRACKLVQAADLIANTLYGKYNYNKSHLYDSLNIKESIKFPHNKFGMICE